MAPPKGPAALLAKNRRDAYDMAARKGTAETRELLEKADRDLRKRLSQVEGIGGAGAESFSAVQLRATLLQVQLVTRDLNAGLQGSIVDQAGDVAEESVGHVVDYLGRANKQFSGVGAQPLALREAAMVDTAVRGVESSVLRRLGSSPGPAQPGILARYGLSVVGHFEEVLQLGLVTRKPWADVRAELTEKSPFLEGAPASWAERITRTELMGAYNRAGWETMRAADRELGDMVKILSATFDGRTGADSYAVHGQIRRTEEAFETWFGYMQHPPNRPNDREVVVPHRLSWPIPEYLAWRSDGEVASRWRQEGRRGSPPGRPTMTTVPLNQFARD